MSVARGLAGESLRSEGDVPLPLPRDIELSDLPFMPLHDKRLTQSRAWLRAKRKPELFFYTFNLWVRAFRERPAGSIEDDDDVLFDAAGAPHDWDVVRDDVLKGWVSIDGRMHHQFVSNIVWELWIGRLGHRHKAAQDSHRAACKRALDKGDEPPDPPGVFRKWIAQAFPETAHYLDRLVVTDGEIQRTQTEIQPTNENVRVTDGENPSDKRPKRREGKVIPPCSSPTASSGTAPPGSAGSANGTHSASPAQRKLWFARELTRLENAFAPVASCGVRALIAEFAQNGASGKFGFVQAFKGCWVIHGGRGPPQLVVPSAKRARAITAGHAQVLEHYLPGVMVRHAKIDELRAFKADMMR